jgi:hypothetical protein
MFTMSEKAPLLPPVQVIHERLTQNQQERRMLRTLLKLSAREAEFRSQFAQSGNLRSVGGGIAKGGRSS